jgi:hypothetical protein
MHRLGQAGQGDDRGGADRAGADHAHLAAPDASWQVGGDGDQAGCIEVISGTSTPQAMTRPASIAMPTVMPIRWPAPISASELDAPMPVAPLPAA